MLNTRREFLAQAAGAVAAGSLLNGLEPIRAEERLPLIIDTHQHLWDLKKFKLPWLEGAPEVLKHNYLPSDYQSATAGLNIRSVYMEVDVDPSQHLAEAEYVSKLSADDRNPTVAAVVGGRPASDEFAGYVAKLKKMPAVRGVRQVLHVPETPPGYCLQESFVRGVQHLGEQDLSFDLCMRPTDLRAALRLTEKCSDTRFVLDHCGNADVAAFGSGQGGKASHDADAWRRDIEALAKQPNVICKISGIIARAPQGWKPADLAPIVNHCLDSFGPDRVVFGGDWPVCLLGAKLREWIDALAVIIAERPKDQQEKLWHANAVKFYELTLSG